MFEIGAQFDQAAFIGSVLGSLILKASFSYPLSTDVIIVCSVPLQLTETKAQCEDKLRGLVPVCVRQVMCAILMEKVKDLAL